MIKQCTKCGSENLYLEPRVKGQDVMTANMVALKCKDCGAWLKWCPKEERQFYITKNKDIKVEECWVIQRDDGMYINQDDGEQCYFNNSLIYARRYENKRIVEFKILQRELQNCRPVKVKIEIVGEDDE